MFRCLIVFGLIIFFATILPAFPTLDTGFIKQVPTTSNNPYQADFTVSAETHMLVKNGSSVTSQINYTTTYFTGNVTNTAVITPVESSTPQISFHPSIIELTQSRHNAISELWVNASKTIESRLYTLTVTASSGVLSHSITIIVGVTSKSLGPDDAELVYHAITPKPVQAGNIALLNNSFLNLGRQVRIGITNLTATLRFGTFVSTGFIRIDSFETRTSLLRINIPNTIQPGNYSITVSTHWVMNPDTATPLPGPTLVSYDYLIVSAPLPSSSSQSTGYGNPLGTPEALLFGFGMLGLCLLAAVALTWEEKRRLDNDPSGRL